MLLHKSLSALKCAAPLTASAAPSQPPAVDTSLGRHVVSEPHTVRLECREDAFLSSQDTLELSDPLFLGPLEKGQKVWRWLRGFSTQRQGLGLQGPSKYLECSFYFWNLRKSQK